jgi:hypothetical protein
MLYPRDVDDRAQRMAQAELAAYCPAIDYAGQPNVGEEPVYRIWRAKNL